MSRRHVSQSISESKHLVNRARIAQKKMKTGKDGTRTVAQVNWEIVHLQKKARMIQTMIDVSKMRLAAMSIRSYFYQNPPELKGSDGNAPSVPKGDKEDAALTAATKEYLAKATVRDNMKRKE